MGTLVRCVIVYVVVIARLDWVRGHGRLIEPAARNSMWRLGYKNPKNYNDMGLNCGGFTNQFEGQFGRCGVCGDPYQGPREHEAGGRYARGLVARQYNSGSYINVTVELTSNHMGYFEFRLCPVNDPHKRATKACLDRHVLTIAGHGRRYFISQRQASVYVEMFVQLPPNLRCSQCVLQWKWVAGQSMGPDGYGGECLGCGNQENFVNCADIAIGTTPVRPLPPPAGGFKEPEPVAPPAPPKKYVAHAGAVQQARAPQRGPPYQVNSPQVNSPAQKGGAPVFDGTMASILAQVFQMASKANRISPAGAARAAVAAAAAAAQKQPQKAAPTWNKAATPKPPTWNPPAPEPPTWNPATPKPPNWNPVTPKPQVWNQVTQKNPTWNPTTAKAQVWNPVNPKPPAWNTVTPKPQAWNHATASPVLNNIISGFATSTPSWMAQQGWQSQANSWAQSNNPFPNPQSLQAAANILNVPTGWNQNPTPSGTSYSSEYTAADYAGNEPGEYPEVGELPPPGTRVPGQGSANTNSGASYMQGFNDAVNQLKRNLGLSTGNNVYSGKINAALTELSVSMQEQQKRPSSNGATHCAGGAQRECVAGGAFAGNSDFDSWCSVSCNAGQCPANMCSCTCPGGGGGAWNGGAGCRAVDRTKGASMDTWCVANCKQNNCPSDLCVCGFST